MARHWQWPVVLMAGVLLGEGPLAAGPFAERARVVAALVAATLAFAGMGTSWGSRGLRTGAGPSLSAVPPIAPAVRWGRVSEAGGTAHRHPLSLVCALCPPIARRTSAVTG